MECIKCRGPIPRERLRVLPDTRLCVRCSEAVGGDVEVRVVEERSFTVFPTNLGLARRRRTEEEILET